MLRSGSRFACQLMTALLLATSFLWAQPSRIVTKINRTQITALAGSVHPLARAEYDQGPVNADLPLQSLTLVLSKTPRQHEALDELLKDQQDPGSANFHRWLTPEEFAERFGVSTQDLAALASWLQGEGFTVWHVARSRTFLQFSGTAAQVAKTFGTEIRRYEVNGERHYANATEPAIPVGLAPIVSAIHGLNDFYPKPALAHRKQAAASPFYTWAGGYHALAPGDLATIYDIAPLVTLGYNGTGQSVAIAGSSDINLSDVALYRSTFGLPAAHVVEEVYGADPGTVSDWFDEGNLDLDVVSAIAPQATIYFVISANVWNSVISAVDNNYAPVISMSFGSCEPESVGWAPTIRGIAQQANAEGITMVASSGDSGAAGCDGAGNSSASMGLAVSLPASIPEVTGVGGTQFNQGGGTYWSSQNSATGGSALSYMPEAAWTDGGSDVVGTGGGVSVSYPGKPSWQVGPGVPNDGSRDVPDVSFDASPGDVGYVVALSGALSTASGETWGGTSASAPLFAGVVALLNQYEISTRAATTAGLGNVNPRLYTLAQNTTNVFHDITQGSNVVPCAAGSPNCGSHHTMGYSAGPGYDPVTGLGTIDVYNLFLNWSSNATPGPAISGLSPSTLTSGGATFTLTVNGSNFASGATVKWGSTALTTTFVSSSRLTAAVTAALVASAGSVSVTVANPGGATSAASTFTITPAGPSISSLSPNAATAGGAAFKLTVNGANFVSGATVSWGATALTTTFVNATQLTASVTAGLIASTGSVNVTVAIPGGAASGAASFSVTAAGPSISSLSPSSTQAGSAAFTLTVNGSSFASGASVKWGSTALTTSFVSAVKLTASVPASLVATQGSVNVTVTNPGGATSGQSLFSVTAGPVPAISSLSPNAAASGSATFTLTVSGSNFATGATVMWGTMALTTSFVNSSQLTASVSSNLVSSPGTVSVTVKNLSGSTSAAASFAISGPAISSLSPNSATAGGVAFTLTVSGSGFASGAVVKWGSTALTTTYANSGKLTASVAASLIASPTSANVTVTNPGGAVSSAASFSVLAQAASVSSLSPSSAAAGSAAFSLTVNGKNFVPGTTVLWGGTSLSTVYSSSSRLTASVPASLLTTAGSVNVTVVLPGGATTAASVFTVSAPAISSINPTSVATGASFTLTVSGSNFVSGSKIYLGNSALTTSYTNSASLRASVTASLTTSPGTLSVKVVNPGNATSSTVNLTVKAPTPLITSVSPRSAVHGGPSFTLTVTGSNFISGAVIQWKGSALATSFASSTKLTANVPSSLITSKGTAQITVSNPGETASAAMSYTIQ